MPPPKMVVMVLNRDFMRITTSRGRKRARHKAYCSVPTTEYIPVSIFIIIIYTLIHSLTCYSLCIISNLYVNLTTGLLLIGYHVMHADHVQNKISVFYNFSKT